MGKNKKKKKVPSQQHKIPNDKKTVRVSEDPDRWKTYPPTWRFSNYDRNNTSWCIHNCSNFISDILEKLISFEGMNWNQVLLQNGGPSRGTNNHFVEASYFIKDAQKRLDELQLEELFSLRLGGTQRLYGTINDGTFEIIWYDEDHKLVLSKKRNT